MLALVVAWGREARRYWSAYTTTYPAQAADDFQYGYREAIAFMEARRDQYDLLLLTANASTSRRSSPRSTTPNAPAARRRCASTAI